MNTTLATERLEELEAEAPDALRLARLASLAVRVERHLLRRLRLELLPGMDVGSEADLWFSPVIESRGSGSFVIDAAVALLLRRDLAHESETFERAANITEVEHRHLPASILLEEQVHAISARGGDDVLARIDDAMAPALRALREGGERGKEIARWAMRALPRFDPVVRESATSLALLLGASALLGGRRIVHERTSSRASLNQFAWAIPAAALSKRVRVALEVTDNAVRFIDDAGDRPVPELPGTIPRLVEVSWAHGDAEIVNLIEADIGNSFQVDPGVSALTLCSLDGNEYLLQKQSAEQSPRRAPPEAEKGTCFVVMGFGKKTDFETGRVLDLDRTYRNIIKPAVLAAGLQCIRADEIKHSGAIDYDQLLNADVVIADLSTSYKNAYYELGVRHGLRPYTTVVICEDGTKTFPFDVPVLQYHHLGEGIDYEETERFRNVLTEVIVAAEKQDPRRVDSPVYSFLPGLQSGIRGAGGLEEPNRGSFQQPATKDRTCFVTMGFGKKTDFETGRVLDLDRTYRNIIKPAVTAAGLECIRADEIKHSGAIDMPRYDQLLNADVVVADLSTSNKNAYYELGVRHALRPYTTVIICEDGIKTFPFDVNHVAVLQYHHMGEGIDYDEMERFRRVLTESILAVYNQTPRRNDSPVYTFLNQLTPPALAAAVQGIAEAAAKSAPAADGESDGEAESENAKLYSELMEEVEEAKKAENFDEAKSLLKLLRKRIRHEDPYIIQQLALVTYKARHNTSEQEIAALREACDLLAVLQPETANDTETLGLWGAVHKRLWDKTKDPGALDKAIRAYERGFYIRNDYYNGINFAFLLNIRAAHAAHLASSSVGRDAALQRAESVADFVQARRVRENVISICDQWLASSPAPDKKASDAAQKQYLNNKYWVVTTKAEAYLGTGKTAAAEATYQEAYAFAPAPWMIASAKEQRGKLEQLLADSPLQEVA